MKRVCFAAAAALWILLCFASCAKADPLVGRWRTRFFSEEMDGNVTLIYEFRADGTIHILSEKEDFTVPLGTYETEGEKMVIRSGGGAEEYVFSVTNETLTLRQNGRETSFEKLKDKD